MQKYLNNVVNQTGAPVSASVLVTNYPSGTTATIYSANGSGVMANPLSTDANGNFSFYAADGRYSLTISGVGLTTQTISDILLQDPADGGEAGSFTTLVVSGTSALAAVTATSVTASAGFQATLPAGVTSKAFGSSGSTTGAMYGLMQNTSGSMAWGVESSIAGGIVTGSTPYASVVYSTNATTLQFGTNSQIQATLDTNGNLGLGNPPNAWDAGFKVAEISPSGYLSLSLAADINSQYQLNNAYYSGGAWKYKNTKYALMASQDASLGKYVWNIAPSGTAGTNVAFTQAMTLDASGRLLVPNGTVVTPVAFASLPASPVAGQRAMINNSVAAPAFLSTAAGGGSTTVPVFYNGTTWLVG